MSSFMLRPNESIPYTPSALKLNEYMSEMNDDDLITLIEIGKIYKNYHQKELNIEAENKDI